EEGEARWLRHHPEAAGAADTAEEETAVERDDPGMPARLRAADPEAMTMSRAALYHPSDVDVTVQLFHPVAYEESLQVAPGISAKFHDAGHILGSAIIELTVEDAGGPLTVVFSGGLGRRDTPILRHPTPISRAYLALREATYRTRAHSPMEHAVTHPAARA